MGDTNGRLIFRRPDGSFYIRNASPEEIEERRRQGGAGVVEIPDEQFQELQRSQQREEEFGTPSQQLLTFLEGGANSALVGLPAAVEDAAGLGFGADQRRAENPNAELAGNIAGIVLPATAALRGTQAASMTAGGATALLGEGVASGLARRFTGSLGQALAPVAGVVADGAASGALMSIENSLVNEDPLTAQRILADTGMGAALGLGLGGAFAGGRYLGRGSRALAGGYAERLARVGLEEGASNLSWWRRGLVNTSRLLGQGTETLLDIADPRTARLAAEGEQVANRVVRRTTQVLDDFIDLGQEIIPNAERRMEVWSRLAEGVDPSHISRTLLGAGAEPGEVARFAQTLEDMSGRITTDQASTMLQRARRAVTRSLGTLDNLSPRATVTPAAARTGVGSASSRAAAEAQARRAAGAASRPNITVAQAIEAIDGLDNALSIASRAPRDLTGASARDVEMVTNLIQAQRQRFQAILGDQIMVGPQAASTVNNFRELTNRAQQLEEQVLRNFGTEVAEDGALTRRIDGEKITRLFRESTDERSARRADTLRSYIEASRTRNEMLGELFQIDPEVTRRTTGTFVRELEQELADGTERFVALGKRNRAVAEERGLAGFGIVTGLSAPAIGGAIGYAMDQPAAGVGIGLAAGAILKPASFFALLGNMDNGVRQILGRRAAGVAAVRRTLSGRGGLRAIGRAGSRKIPAIVQRLQSAETRRDTYRESVEDIRNLATNPDLLEARVTASLGEVADNFPTMYTHQVETIQRGLQYLAASIPPAETPGLFDHVEPMEPSLSEMDAFVRKVHALEDPYSILKKAADFTLHPDEVDAVATVYPEIYSQIQQDVAGLLEEVESLPPYQARIQVGTLLQVPSDPSLDPSFILTMQRRFAQTENQQQASFGSRASISVAGNTYSEAQQVQMRL